MQPQLGGAQASDRDGFYSVSDYQEILRFASRHYVQVIPSLDMPGHSRAAIKAMEARYQYYIEQENEEEASRYLLSDFTDKLAILTMLQPFHQHQYDTFLTDVRSVYALKSNHLKHGQQSDTTIPYKY